MPERKVPRHRLRPDLPDLLLKLRLAAQLSQREMAEAAGLRGQYSDQVISKWEHGHVTPHENTILRVAMRFRIDPESFFVGWSGKTPAEQLMERQEATGTLGRPQPKTNIADAMVRDADRVLSEVEGAPASDKAVGEPAGLYRDLCEEVKERKRPMTKSWVLSLLEELHYAHLGVPKPRARGED